MNTNRRWCHKCEAHVGPLHMHHVSWYIARPDGGWACRWCRAPLKSNNVKCRCGLGPQKDDADD